MFHYLQNYACVVGNLAGMAGQLGNMVEHPNQSQPNPGTRPDETPCRKYPPVFVCMCMYLSKLDNKRWETHNREEQVGLSMQSASLCLFVLALLLLGGGLLVHLPGRRRQRLLHVPHDAQ